MISSVGKSHKLVHACLGLPLRTYAGRVSRVNRQALGT